MNRPLRILAFVPALGSGGAEKHVVRIASSVDPARATIDVGVARRGDRYERELGARSELLELGIPGIRSSTGSILACAPRLRAAMTSGRWDAVVAFLDRPSLLALAVHATIPRRARSALLLSVQADPVSTLAEDPMGPAFERAIRSLYRRADGVLAISTGVREALLRYDPRLDPIVVPNACVDVEPVAIAAVARTPASIVACGRLVPQKGFDVLLDAFARVRAAMPEATLRILGVGPDREALLAQAARLGLGESVSFVGFVDDPRPEYARAELFCLSSRFEGLGMVVVEAMNVGTPVVSTDCPHGPAEILEGGRFGPLVPVGDPVALGDALLALLRDPVERARLAGLARTRADDYRSDRIAGRFVDAVERAVVASRAKSAS